MPAKAKANTSNSQFSRTQQAYQHAWERKDFSMAEKHARKLVKSSPTQAYSWRALGACQIELAQPEQALDSLQEAMRVAPDDAHAAYLAGTAHRTLKQWDAAKEQFEQALHLNPRHAMAHTQYASILHTKGDTAGALDSIQTARALAPDNPVILTQSISIHSAARKIADVMSDCEQLLRLDDSNPQYFNLVAAKHCEMGLFDQAAEYYEKALALKPDYLEAFSNRVFNAHYDPNLSAEDIARLTTRWHNVFNPKNRPSRPETGRDAERPLTLGLLSAGLRNHPVGQMITSALEQLPAAEFKLIAYSTSDTEDRVTARLQKICSGWHRMKGYSDDVLETKIREDKIDILIDLSGHTDGNRLQLVAREPAPLIVKWVGGLVNTTGLEAIDYLISDAVETPPGCDEQYYENLIRLPDDYICYMPPNHAPAVGELPARRQGHITFGCLNNPAKLNDTLIREWATLLHEVANSQLLLRSAQYSDPTFCERVWQRFETAGIERSRIVMEGPAAHAEFLDTYNRIDIALDPWPYSGGLTTCEALLMGVPVITLPGPTFAGRHAATHLVNAGLPELVVDSWESYRTQARNLAGDLDSLGTIRQHLREILKQSPVCDAPRFAGHLTTALRGIWQRHCLEQAPAALTFKRDGSALFEGQAAPLQPRQTEGPNLLEASYSDEKDSFQFNFNGKLIVLDNGGRLLEEDMAETLGKLGAFEQLIFDPTSRHLGTEQKNGLQYFPNTSLGNGAPATMYACLDPALSSALRPIDSTDPNSRVLAELPLPTIALDSIEGLPGLDWLILDQRSESPAILQAGKNLLASTLLLQVRVLIQPFYEGQPDIGAITKWTHQHGFQLYRFERPQHVSRLPREMAADYPATQLHAIDMLFIPDARRMLELDGSQREKLAFLLHTVFGYYDLTYDLISMDSAERAAQYLQETKSPADSAQQNASPKPQHAVSIPDAPFMSEAERALFKSHIARAARYFEFGSGGSTVWACEAGLTVHGVESDEDWVNALRDQLGEHCQVQAVDIGPTREWGFPVGHTGRARFPDYSEAILHYDCSFDLVLVDGRFRVACTLNAIRQTLNTAVNPQSTRFFIHDFWNRKHYHAVLEFLEEVESAETAGVFRIKPDLDMQKLTELLERYRYQPD
ncbi:tetratricopeptide repeat protein [Microbulbifer aggregans]|uniref:O-linked N-acetylglucosamine transferase, SPINDLY family protein n=1 Tax=Microbulbifer aggregans TaxID=1769779 RepID=UPI001CFE746F|nr:tetratricopeptide repeat protein [Microbulbifer aggregans]